MNPSALSNRALLIYSWRRSACIWRGSINTLQLIGSRVSAGLHLQMRLEVGQQAERLNWHPSVCVWGGNNEVEAAFKWFPASRAHPER